MLQFKQTPAAFDIRAGTVYASYGKVVHMLIYAQAIYTKDSHWFSYVIGLIRTIQRAVTDWLCAHLRLHSLQ